MKQIEREQIRKDYIDMTEQSWTYERLTPEEQDNIIRVINTASLYGNNRKQVYNELHFIYSAFLTALNYHPLHWREKEN